MIDVCAAVCIVPRVICSLSRISFLRCGAEDPTSPDGRGWGERSRATGCEVTSMTEPVS